VGGEPGQVFEYFIDPAKMVMWMGTEADARPPSRRGVPDQPVWPGGHARRVLESIDLTNRLHVGLETALFKRPTPVDAGGVSLTPEGETRVRLVPPAPEARGGCPASSRLAVTTCEARAPASGGDPGSDPGETSVERRGAARRRALPE